jgi:hypothetical protein
LVVVIDSCCRKPSWDSGAEKDILFDPEGVIMLNHGVVRCAVGIFLFTGCATPSLVDRSVRVHDIHISGPALLSSVEVYAAVGDEIRWHNQLTVPIYLGFLGVSPIKEVGFGKGWRLLLPFDAGPNGEFRRAVVFLADIDKGKPFGEYTPPRIKVIDCPSSHLSISCVTSTRSLS